MDGLRLAVSWLSVLPVPARTVDARSCRHAIILAPLVGALLGGIATATLWASAALGAPPLLAALLTVTVLVLGTRGMHIDGLADTIDGLGCYGSPERALAVMRDGGAGPFAVAGLILAIGMQAAALAEVVVSSKWLVVVLACATGRAAFVFCCRKGIPAARPEGMGALVAGSQHPLIVAGWWAVLLAASVVVGGWSSLAGVALAGVALLALARHVQRRLGGITGDVLGAGCEIATTIVLVASVFG